MTKTWFNVIVRVNGKSDLAFTSDNITACREYAKNAKRRKGIESVKIVESDTGLQVY